MTARRSSKQSKNGRRQDLGDGTSIAWPGAVGKFALFAEVLFVGVLTVGGSVLLISFPAALAASSEHLHRYLLAEKSTVSQWWSDYREALRTGWIVGCISVVLFGVILLNVFVAGQQVLPGWQIVSTFGVIVLVMIILTLLQSAVRWNLGLGWKQALQQGLKSFITDPGAIAPLLTAMLLTGIVTWQLPPLLLPSMGCLVFAVIAMKERKH